MKTPDDRTLTRVMWRVLPLICLAWIVCILDRLNLSFAASRLNSDVGLSAAAYGFGAGLFFLGYFVFEIPSNLILARIGARRWIARIMVTWGFVSMAMALVSGPHSFYLVRLLLGIAEAGFVPGAIYYVNQWFPPSHVRRPLGILFAFGPLASAIGAPLSLFLIDRLGWHAMFVIEALPAIALGIAIYFLLPDQADDATWLSPAEKAFLADIAPGSQRQPQKRSTVAIMFSRGSVLLAIQYFLILTTAYTIQLWLPLIAHELGFPPQQLMWVVAIPYGLAAITVALFGLTASASTRPVPYVMVSMLLTAAGFLIGAVTTNLAIVLACFCLVMCGTYLGASAFWTLPRSAITGAGAAASIALSNAFGNVGGFIGPYFMGLARERFGNYQSALTIAGALSVVAAMMTLITARTK